MTAHELYNEWCKRMGVTAKSIVKLHEEGLISDDYQSAFLEAVKTSMNTMQVIMTERQ